MFSLPSIISTPKLLWGGILLGIDLMINPTPSLFLVMIALILLDFATGVGKAVVKKEARTSQGFRKTVVKVAQYVVPVAVIWGLSVVFKRDPDTLQYVKPLRQAAGYLMLFISYIEVTSIFENLYEMDQKSVISKYIYKNALRLLKFGIENNPVKKAADELDKKEKQP